MNAWTIYWILQLDSINSAFFVCPFLTLGAIAFIAFVSDGEAVFDESEKRFYKWPKVVSGICAVMLFISIFIPSTKTMAAMVVIPAIANNETIRKESGELYDLAKQALRDAVTDKAKEVTKEATK